MSVSKVFLSVLLLVLVPLAAAFNISGDRWFSGSTQIFSGLSGSSRSGISFQSGFETALNQWNAADFEFVLSKDFKDPCSGLNGSGGGAFGSGDGFNSVAFRDDVCGSNFGDDVLAVTLSFTEQGSLGFAYYREADIIFNNNYVWDIYSGQKTGAAVDFQRVALHELGHVIGLDHELGEAAIMAPRLGNIDTLTADDIAGIKALYGGPFNCAIKSIATNRLVHESLSAGDCRIQDLFNSGTDNSFVDTYQFSLAETSTVNLLMSSTALDSVILVTDTNLNPLHILDDTPDGCDVGSQLTLAAGEYYILANTYVVGSEKCFGNTGEYTLAVTQSSQPWLSRISNSSGGAKAQALFTGGARLAANDTYQQRFAATDLLNVEAAIAPDPAHVGREGQLYVLALLSDGRRFMKDAGGQFIAWNGKLSSLQPLRSGKLNAVENITVVQGLKGSSSGLAGQVFRVFPGYALADSPAEIHYSNPISFSIDP